MDNYSIRPYSRKDKKVLIDIICEFQEFERKILPTRAKGTEEVARYYINHILSQNKKFEGQLFILEVNGKFAGYTNIYIQEDSDKTTTIQKYAYASDFYIVPEKRGKGLGKLLVKTVSDYALEKGLEYLRLNVVAVNFDAVRFYEREGFVKEELSMVKKLVS